MKEFIQHFFSVNPKDYVNLGWDIEINKLLMILLPLMLLVCVAVHIFRKNMFYVVKQLTRHGATDEASAKTLGALGLGNNAIVRFMLGRDGQLTRIVKRRGEPSYTYEEYRQLEKEKKLKKEKIDFSTAEFYLVDRDNRASKILERYDIPVFKTVLVCVFIVAIFMCLALLMPEILMLLDSVVGFIKGLYS